MASEYKKELCQIDNVLTESSGIIQTPAYPAPSKNINCKVVYSAPGFGRKLISIYTVSTSLEFYALIGGKCSKAFYQINGGEKVCAYFITFVSLVPSRDSLVLIETL